jgi:hypothetical protein
LCRVTLGGGGPSASLYDPDLDPDRRRRLAERNKPKEAKQVGRGVQAAAEQGLKLYRPSPRWVLG